MTDWVDDIANWFVDRHNAERLEKVMGYTGCRELWLQAELAMWLEKYKRLSSDGRWDTNLRIANGRFDLALHDDKDGYELVLEVKVLGGHYLPKVLTGSAATLESFAAALKHRGWVVDPSSVAGARSFSLLSDYWRLQALESVRNKVLLLVVDNRTLGDSVLGRALANIEFTSQMSRHIEVADRLYARIWQLPSDYEGSA
jgi:hypothetical protein